MCPTSHINLQKVKKKRWENTGSGWEGDFGFRTAEALLKCNTKKDYLIHGTQTDGGRREGIHSCWTSIMKKAFFISFNVCNNPHFTSCPFYSTWSNYKLKLNDLSEVTSYKHVQIKGSVTLSPYCFYETRQIFRRNTVFYHWSMTDASFEKGQDSNFPQILTITKLLHKEFINMYW